MNLRAWFLALGSLAAADAKAVELLQWERIPMAIPLIVGQERIVFVDQNVRVGMPPQLAGLLRVQSTGGAVYLLASQEIPPTRLQLQNVTTGEIMLVDIAATPAAEGQAKLEPAKIVAGAAPATYYGDSTPARKTSKPTMASEEEEVAPAPRHETPAPVALTRYAAQMLYAPLRTVEPVAGISQVRVDKGMDLGTLLPVLPVEASVLGAWRLDNSYVTAVKLRNRSAQQLTMNPTELMGNFTTATFQHPYLGARGNATDTTTLYLVTQGKGLKEALLPSSISQVDPKAGGRRGQSEK
ncbi:TIGR03749 family integrating conjugative element protein [Pseudomonas asiatica]|uniref:TIGR03749 family integrating conjugative element protein n=1 Tax=Pseudomonas asiatica TaxID=2219225 RepID=A0ABU5KVU8_9PSED|nr:TIGR03749 family integrating conjugative element protein [Pseudomonas asiatica]MDZ5738046.1 TIGR03749 family integrating conjugative element protein [Pseudomonas asiatica]MDZ5744642.1 TIGR03749 family integrating conjugative element protein [Pseudomonas asiatica]MDZ5748802.1 TIGR03749 family integrating conjugative element protein [Pseudomonas asiatica]MDZ5753134.1 TIGR03749 family integrating conjugative element protein [Pseudomonas asiatica]